MQKTDITKALQRASTDQGFITLAELTAAFGCKDPKAVKRKFLVGLEAVNGKYYLISDVAAVIKSQCVVTPG